MAVFIALLDDDPADRKQSERLLSRERDERVKKGEVIYYDSYGSEEALLPSFMKYDLFLIDVTGTTRDGMMVAVDLKNRGAEGKIILYYDKIDYRAKYGDEEGISFMQKPLWQKDFSRLIDIAREVHENKTPRIELRGDKDTIYVTKDEIIYAVEQGYYVAVALTGNRSFHVLTDMVTFYGMLDPKEFAATSRTSVINMNHVVSSKGTSFKMADGAVIKFSLLDKKAITKKYEEFAKDKR
ncbi:MAG: LytTR family transcriptional regulator DNA-binding domain-containing protein [Lachnospiraceae bacterium]|nr:LytTR family transcriptional regulator DNA-binding domain-containing protein [Lachnospiraceae bacterium]MBR1524371.1 LytTR family transcriptional regulator DNA-binding domain-containing protein [Lachnospiraceae bacterium]